MRVRSKLLLCGVCTVLVLLGTSVPALAGLSWCSGGCPPGLSGNAQTEAFNATAHNEQVDLHAIHPKVGNTTQTETTPAAEHNPNFDDFPG